MVGLDRSEDEFLTVARQAVRTAAAEDYLTTLGWWDLLGQLDDPDVRTAVFALFRAQGGALSHSAALGGLIAQPYLARLDESPGSVVAGIGRRTGPKANVTVFVGHPGPRRLLIDQPGRGAVIIDTDQVELRRIEIPGGQDLHEALVDVGSVAVAIPEDTAAPARERALFLGRVAIAMEILGAAERAVELARGYASEREQFGQPIATFQAVRHLLAWGLTGVTAIEAVTYQAIDLDLAAPADFGAIVKALAGRNGLRVCERTLQVLGAIGFTAEYDHHHLHSRVLALDALLGTSAELTTQLGAHMRATGSDLLLPASILAGAASPI